MQTRPVCSCQPSYLGAPPNCRPECTTNSECARDKSCVNKRCIDPCPGVCGTNAVCRAVNHNPICSCMHGYIGDPFTRCSPRKKYLAAPSRLQQFFLIRYHFDLLAQPTALDVPAPNPCIPSPCGPNSICSVYDSRPVCSCITNYIGRPPNCRPECTLDSECPSNLACVCDKCKDPCYGTCGPNAQCHVVSHRPRCYCIEGFTGDPFSACHQVVQCKACFNVFFSNPKQILNVWNDFYSKGIAASFVFFVTIS